MIKNDLRNTGNITKLIKHLHLCLTCMSRNHLKLYEHTLEQEEQEKIRK